jgi:uroporphyrinogen-III synthase
MAPLGSPTSAQALHALHVVVTRPQAQASTVRDALQAAGASVWLFPTLEIAASAAEHQATVNFADYHFVIFISVNAVHHAFAAPPSNAARHTCQPQLFDGSATSPAALAVGPATASALQARGVACAMPTQHSTEGLLALACLRDASPGARVLIVRGVGGSPDLAEGLRASGVSVDEIAVYQRQLPRPEPGALAGLACARGAVVVLVTSVQSFDNLWLLVDAEQRECLAKAAYFAVASTRIGAHISIARGGLASERIWHLGGADTAAVVHGLARHWAQVKA